MSDQKGHGHSHAAHTDKPASPPQGQAAEVTTPRQDQIERNEEIRSEGNEATHAPTDEERAAAETPANEPLKAGEEPETGSTPA